MSTLKAINIIHPSGSTNNIVNDASGNIGVGTTPSAWTVFKVAQVGSGAAYTSSGTTNARMFANTYYDGAYKYIGTGRATQYEQDGYHAWSYAGSGTAGGAITWTEAMRIDTSGNVGIGVQSPNARLELAKTSGVTLRLNDLTTNYWDITNNSNLTFNRGGTEYARIDSSGNLLVGGTTSPTGSGNIYANTRVYVGTTNTDPTANRVNGVNILSGGSLYARANTSWDLGRDVTSGQHIGFYTDNGSARVTAGNISSNGNVTSYNTGSDYRLKEDVAPMIGGLQTISALKPVTYTWIGNKQKGDGFIAHELQEVIPLAVTGEKDAVNEDGSIKPQGVDYSKIVVHLVAAIQELKAQNDELKARVAALEAK